MIVPRRRHFVLKSLRRTQGLEVGLKGSHSAIIALRPLPLCSTVAVGYGYIEVDEFTVKSNRARTVPLLIVTFPVSAVSGTSAVISDFRSNVTFVVCVRLCSSLNRA